jgi:hypothetical protein
VGGIPGPQGISAGFAKFAEMRVASGAPDAEWLAVSHNRVPAIMMVDVHFG